MRAVKSRVLTPSLILLAARDLAAVIHEKAWLSGEKAVIAGFYRDMRWWWGRKKGNNGCFGGLHDD